MKDILRKNDRYDKEKDLERERPRKPGKRVFRTY
jgi:hypothetical protein